MGKLAFTALIADIKKEGINPSFFMSAFRNL
jgi:hydrogenase maturation factor